MERKVFKLWLVASVFCLAVFASFAEGQVTGSLKSEIRTADSNVTKLRKLEKYSQRRKQANVRKWRMLQRGMSMEDVRKLLGRPKLIQGGSHECVWFYQDVPLFDAKPHFEFQKGGEKKKIKNRYGTITKKIALSDIGGIRKGILLFEAKSLDTLIAEEEVKLNAAILEKERKRDEDIDSYRVPRVSYQGGPWEEPPDKEKRLAKGRKSIEKWFATSVRSLEKSYTRRIRRLKEDLKTPVFILAFFNQSDWGRSEDPIKKRTMGQINRDKWRNSDNWKKLKVGVTMNYVHKLLGEPAKSDINMESSLHYYGDINGHGELCYTPNANTEDCLTSWVEPFWPHVTEESGEISDRKPIMGDIMVFKG